MIEEPALVYIRSRDKWAVDVPAGGRITFPSYKEAIEYLNKVRGSG